MTSPRDPNVERLQTACDLLTQVADDLQADLNLALLEAISPERAGKVIRLACRVEALELLASQVWKLRTSRISELSMAQQLEPAGNG